MHHSRCHKNRLAFHLKCTNLFVRALSHSPSLRESEGKRGLMEGKVRVREGEMVGIGEHE